MKKLLLWLLILMIGVSMVAAFSLAGCKTTAAAATTTAAAATTTAAAATTTAAAATTTAAAAETTKAAKGYTIAFIAKLDGIPYFIASEKGAKEAANELGDKLIFQSPANPVAEDQIKIIDSFITQKVDGIAISADDLDALVPVCKKALDAGAKVISWDSGVAKEGTLLFISPADNELVGRIEVQTLAEEINYEGEIAILSTTPETANQNLWIEVMKEELKDPKYAKMKLVSTVYGNDQSEKNYQEVTGLLKTYPNLKGIISPTSSGPPSVSRVLEDQKLNGKIAVTGLALPSAMTDYMLDGTCKKVFIWNPIDFGYMAEYVTHLLISGELKGNVGEEFKAGRLGMSKIVVDDPVLGPTVILGPPLELTKDNVAEMAKTF